jgi:hypothetical protein
MDMYERFMARARAQWRAKLASKTSASPWGYENWANEGAERHHVARAKYGDLIEEVPVSVHRELTRRQMEEHPEDGPDPDNPLERKGRLHLWYADIYELFADLHRWRGEALIRAAKDGASELKD